MRGQELAALGPTNGCVKGVMSEHDEQVIVVSWARSKELRLFSVPNGGQRYKLTAVRLKAEGVERGVPDLELPMARHGHHGLFIEMKFGKNKTTPEQKDWILWLNEQGYKAVVCYTADEAIKVIEEYVGEDTELGGSNGQV